MLCVPEDSLLWRLGASRQVDFFESGLWPAFFIAVMALMNQQADR
jgi:hypothetical protein